MRETVLKILSATVLALLLVGGAGAQQLHVVTTIQPYYSLASQIGGDLVTVTKLLPAGTSPHNFDPSARDVLKVAEADLIIHNGGVGLDEWVLRLMSASDTSAVDLSIKDAVQFEPIGSSAGERELPDLSIAELYEQGHYVNVHIWLDPTIAIGAAEAIAQALIELDPDNALQYQANLEALVSDLRQLDAELSELLEPIRGESFIPFHDAWPYFARRYGLNLLLEIEPFPGREPSPDYLVYALGLIQDSGVKAIFSERQLSPRPAEAVAAEAGLPLFVLDPEGGGSSELETYQDMLRFNAGVLLGALGD